MKKIIILCLLLPTIALYSKDLIIRNIKMKTLVNSLNRRRAAWALALYVMLISALALRAEETVNYWLETVWEKQEYPPIIVTAAKFHPSGEFIYCAIGNEIRKMDAKTGEYVSIFDKKGIPSEANIYKMEMSKDGKFLATTSLSSELFVWDVTEEKFIKEVKVANQTERQSIYAVDFKEQSNIVVFALDSTIDYPNITEKTTVVVYDWQLEKEVFRFDCPGSISELKASPDGKFIATGASWCDVPVKKWHDQLTFWSGADGKHVRTLEDFPSLEKWNGYRLIKFSQNNSYLGSILRPYAGPQIYNINTYERIKKTDGRICAVFEFLPIPDIVISRMSTETTSILELFDLKIQKVLEEFTFGAGILESSIGIGNEILLYDYNGLNTRLFKIKKNISAEEPRKGLIIPTFQAIQNRIYIQANDFRNKLCQINLYDINGKIIYRNALALNEDILYLSDLQLLNGIYLFEIIEKNNRYIQKITISR